MNPFLDSSAGRSFGKRPTGVLIRGHSGEAATEDARERTHTMLNLPSRGDDVKPAAVADRVFNKLVVHARATFSTACHTTTENCGRPLRDDCTAPFLRDLTGRKFFRLAGSKKGDRNRIRPCPLSGRG